MNVTKKHLIDLQNNKVKHWIIELSDNQHIINSGTDLNKLKTSIKEFKDKYEAQTKFTAEIYKKMGADFIFKNEVPKGEFGEIHYHFRVPNNSMSEFIDINPNSNKLAIATIKKDAKGADIHLFDLETSKMELLYTEEPEPNSQTFIHYIQFTADGKKLVYLLNTEVKFLDIESKKSQSYAQYHQYFDGPNPFCFQPGFNSARKRFLYFGNNHLNISEGFQNVIFRLKLDYEKSTSECRLGCISPSGKYLALYHASRFIIYGHKDAESDKTNRIDIWDIDANQIVKTIETKEMKFQKMKFNLTEDQIVATHRYAEGPVFFDIKSAKLIGYYKDSDRDDRWFTCFDFAFSPNGKYLAAGKALFAPNEKQELIQWFTENNRRDNKVLFSTDSKLYIQGGDSGEIFVRNL